MNSTIRKLVTLSHCLLINRESIESTRLSFDDLSIYLSQSHDTAALQLLIELNELGLYKRLSIHVSFGDQLIYINEVLAPMKGLI